MNDRDMESAIDTVGMCLLGVVLLICMATPSCDPPFAPPRLPRPVCFQLGQQVEIEHGFYKGRRGEITELVNMHLVEPSYKVHLTDGDTVEVRQHSLAGGDEEWVKQRLRRDFGE